MMIKSVLFCLVLFLFVSSGEAGISIIRRPAVKPLTQLLSRLRGCPGGEFTTLSLASSPISDTQSNYVRMTIDAAVIRSMVLISESSPDGEGTCQFRKTYGFFGSDVFVNEGCQGDFRLCIVPGTTSVTLCESYSWKPKICDAAPDGTIIRAIVVDRQRSFSFCEKGITYGIRGNTIWVILGCRAYFRVSYVPEV